MTGAKPVAIARAEGISVPYSSRLSKLRILDLHAGVARSDARDATIIAEAICPMPHGLLTQLHPAPTRVPGHRLDHVAVLSLLQRYLYANGAALRTIHPNSIDSP